MPGDVARLPNLFAQTNMGKLGFQIIQQTNEDTVPERFRLTNSTQEDLVPAFQGQEEFEPQNPWYKSFGVEAAKIGLMVGGSLIFGPIGGIAAGFLGSIFGQCILKGGIRKVDWGTVAIDSALGAFPGVGKAFGWIGKKLGLAAAESVAQTGAKSLSRSILCGAKLGAINGGTIGFLGGTANSAYGHYKKSGEFNWNNAFSEGLMAIPSGMLGGAASGGIVKMLSQVRLSKLNIANSNLQSASHNQPQVLQPWQMSLSEFTNQETITLYRGVNLFYGPLASLRNTNDVGRWWTAIPHEAQRYMDHHNIMYKVTLPVAFVEKNTSKVWVEYIQLKNSPPNALRLSTNEIDQLTESWRAKFYAKVSKWRHKVVFFRRAWMAHVEDAIKRGENVPPEILSKYKRMHKSILLEPLIQFFRGEYVI